jgi:hypothetical protein
LIPIFDTEILDIAANPDSCIVEDIVQATHARNGLMTPSKKRSYLNLDLSKCGNINFQPGPLALSAQAGIQDTHGQLK